MACIERVVAGALETFPSGDDRVYLDLPPRISTGVNGITESSAIGDDDQVIPEGNGLPEVTCISPGANGVLESTAAGGDYPFTSTPIPGHYPYFMMATAVPLYGIRAQNNDDPISAFDSHYVVAMQDGSHYDPSYMIGPVTEADHESAIKAGVHDANQLCRPASSVRELIYDPLQ